MKMKTSSNWDDFRILKSIHRTLSSNKSNIELRKKYAQEIRILSRLLRAYELMI